MRIIFNKRGGVGMGVTRPKPVPLPFLPMQQLLDHFCCVGLGVPYLKSIDPLLQGSGTSKDLNGCGHDREHCWKSSSPITMLDKVWPRLKLVFQFGCWERGKN